MTMKKLLSIMLIMVMLVVGLTGCTTQEEEKKPIVVDSFETEVVESGYDDYYLVNVDGYITNTTIVVLGPITIKFEIYNANGDKIKEMIAIVNEIKGEQTKAFGESVMVLKSLGVPTSIELTKITYDYKHI
jgi:hypothetical protein